MTRMTRSQQVEPLPKNLTTKTNKLVLRYLDGKSAHSDLVEKFTEAAGLLDDVSFYCPNVADYRYVLAHTNSIVFAFASGMRSVPGHSSRNWILWLGVWKLTPTLAIQTDRWVNFGARPHPSYFL